MDELLENERKRSLDCVDDAKEVPPAKRRKKADVKLNAGVIHQVSAYETKALPSHVSFTTCYSF